jgi:hypothetical protein
MSKNFLKECYSGRTVFLEPIDNFLERKFTINKILSPSFCKNFVYIRFDDFSDDFDQFYLHEIEIKLDEIKNNDFIPVCDISNKIQKFRLFLDKNLYYSYLISQKEKELENLKNKLINNQ